MNVYKYTNGKNLVLQEIKDIFQIVHLCNIRIVASQLIRKENILVGIEFIT